MTTTVALSASVPLYVAIPQICMLPMSSFTPTVVDKVDSVDSVLLLSLLTFRGENTVQKNMHLFVNLGCTLVVLTDMDFLPMLGHLVRQRSQQQYSLEGPIHWNLQHCWPWWAHIFPQSPLPAIKVIHRFSHSINDVMILGSNPAACPFSCQINSYGNIVSAWLLDQ